MAGPISLKVLLQKHGSGVGYEVIWELNIPNIDNGAFSVSFNPQLFLRPWQSTDRYGQALSDLLFKDQNFRTAFQQACLLARDNNTQLHFQLSIQPNARELERCYWEMMLHPNRAQPLSCCEDILFSRALPLRPEKRPLQPRAKANLRALVAISSPRRSSSGQQLTPFDVEGEAAWIRDVLNQRQIPFDMLMTGTAEPCTLSNLRKYVRSREYDLVYLVCHSVIHTHPEETYLLLETESGFGRQEKGQEVANAMTLASGQLQLVILSTCHSAVLPSAAGGIAAGGREAWSLGQELIRNNGVPAVIAMRDAVTLPTMREMMPVFLEQVLEDGRVGRAMAAARQEVTSRTDWWMPVLYTNLPDTRLWWEEPKPAQLPVPVQRKYPVFILPPLKFQRKRAQENLRAQKLLPGQKPLSEQPKFIFMGKRRRDGKPKTFRVVRPVRQAPGLAGTFEGLEPIFNQVDQALTAGVRVINLHGDPGSGRSTLAALLAERYAAQYPDGNLYYPYPVDDPLLTAEVEDMLAHLLHSYLPYLPAPDTQAEMEQKLGRVLAKKQALVWLEDADEEALAAPLLPLLPRGLLLVTSCRALSLDPQLCQSIALGPLEASLARQVLLKSKPDADKLVNDLLRHVCGRLPLSLQLFARLLENHRDFSAQEIARQAVEQQHASGQGQLAAVLALSLRFLRADQADALRQLSVFSGAFDAFAAAAVLKRAAPEILMTREADQARLVQDMLEQLACQGLVEYEPRGQRYRLHPLVRAEAFKQLIQAQELAAEAQMRHAEAYLYLLSDTSALYQRSQNDGLPALQRFDQDWREIQRGQRFAALAGEDEQKRANLCMRYWEEGRFILANRLTLRQRKGWLRDAMGASGNALSSWSLIYSDMGAFFQDKGDFKNAVDYHTRGLRIKRDMHDWDKEVKELLDLANVYREQNRYLDQISCYDRCLKNPSVIKDEEQQAWILYRRGIAYWEVDRRKALEDFFDCEALSRRKPDNQLRCEVSLRLGRYYFDRRKELAARNEAKRWYRQALDLSLQVGNPAVEKEARARLEDLNKD